MSKVIALFATIPFGLFAAAYAAYPYISGNYSLSDGFNNFAYIIYGIALLLSWWFNRSRVFYVIVVIALAQFALSESLASSSEMPNLPARLYSVVCVLLPINIVVFSLLRERGIFTVWGLGRFGIIGCQIFYIALAIIANDNSLLSFFYKDNVPQEMAAVAMPQTAIMLYAAIVFFFLRKQMKKNSLWGNAFMAVSAATFFGLSVAATSLAVPYFFGAAGVIFILALIQDFYAMAYLDELTGLPGRRALTEELMKLRGEYTIAMVDIDFFKKFNDTYGHDVGDEVLRLVASVLRKVSGGKAFRYGGEEFAIIFPSAIIDEAIPHLENLRQAVAKTPYAYRADKENKARKKALLKKLSVTISIGVAGYSQKHNQPDAVIKAADAALYRAKENGRNCVSE